MKNIGLIIPKEVREISKKKKKTLDRRIIKLGEEYGELAAEVLKFQGEKSRKGKTKKEVLYDLHLEAVDCLLMSMDILCKTGATEERIREIMSSQLEKWKDKSR